MRYLRMPFRVVKKLLWGIVIAADYLLMALVSSARPTTRDAANEVNGQDGLYDGYRLGPDRIPEPGRQRNRPS